MRRADKMKDELIHIRHANLKEKHKTYQWLCCSDTTQFHTGPPLYPENPIPTWEMFQEDFEDFYYREDGRQKGSVMIIEVNGEEIGCLCYALFHLNPLKAELDIWMKSSEYCGKGYGSRAIEKLVLYLIKQFHICNFIIRPSTKNVRAIRAYEKAGFRKIDDSQKRIVLLQFINKQYSETLGQGDYGFEDTAILTFKV